MYIIEIPGHKKLLILSPVDECRRELASCAEEICTVCFPEVTLGAFAPLKFPTGYPGLFFGGKGIQARIQDLVRGAELPRPKVADIAEQSCASEASYLRPGSKAHLSPWKLLIF